jgi:hypothetical protein
LVTLSRNGFKAFRSALVGDRFPASAFQAEKDFPPNMAKTMIDRMERRTRTLAQIAASANNVTLSRGPISAEGKAMSATNAITTGIASRGVLMPGERLEEVETNLAIWVETLAPQSAGEGQLVAEIADIQRRKARLDLLEQRHIEANLEKKLRETDSHRRVETAREAKVGLTALGELAVGITVATSADRVTALLPAIHRVAELVAKVDLPLAIIQPLDNAVQDLVLEAGGSSVAPDAFAAIGTATEMIIKSIDDKLPDLEAAVQRERERLMTEVLLGDDKQLRRFTEHRTRLGREMERRLAALRSVRELAGTEGKSGPGSFNGPILVELRVVGRKAVS